MMNISIEFLHHYSTSDIMISNIPSQAVYLHYRARILPQVILRRVYRAHTNIRIDMYN